MGVKAEGKGRATTRSGDWQEEDRNGTTAEVSTRYRRCQNRGGLVTAGVAPTKPAYGRSGIRHERWPELAKEAVKRKGGTLDTEANGKATKGSNHKGRGAQGEAQGRDTPKTGKSGGI